MAITDKQVDDMCRKLLMPKEIATTDDLVKEMVDRFLCWKLPRDFHPDCGIHFDPEYNVEYMAKQGLPPSRHEPLGTNLFHAEQAEEMVRHMLGLPNVVESIRADERVQAASDIQIACMNGDLPDICESAGDFIVRPNVEVRGRPTKTLNTEK